MGIIAICLGLTQPLHAQFTIQSGSPADGTANLGGAVNLCLTFSAALDTSQRYSVNGDEELISPIGVIIAEPQNEINMTGWSYNGASRTLCFT